MTTFNEKRIARRMKRANAVVAAAQHRGEQTAKVYWSPNGLGFNTFKNSLKDQGMRIVDVYASTTDDMPRQSDFVVVAW